ncbi:oxysterol-binding protein 1-like isoform X2 [Tachypleus tridentatus]|uniref:oxysterol-binding protein 1-like isoform X2 n=1 Tax=Tachypleus tridentatus TaxID=6853 RepID=UPI003FD4301D
MGDLKPQQQEAEMKGWLHKWTNYLKGYQKRWFVLSNGLLSYYRNQAEMAHSCRGTISLVSAVIHTVDSSNFIISNGGTQTFHLKAANEIERQRWVTALELAKARAIRITESEDEDDYNLVPTRSDKNELQTMLKLLSAKLEDLTTCNNLIIKHGTALQRSLTELEQLESGSDSTAKVKAVNERATLFRITSNAMINACSECLQLAQSQLQKWQKMLQYEHEQRIHLEEMVEQLAKQHSHLEQIAKEATKGTLSPVATYSDDDEFYDAEEHATGEFLVTLPGKGHRRTCSGMSLQSEGQGYGDGASSESDTDLESEEARVITRRRSNQDESHDTNKPSWMCEKSENGSFEQHEEMGSKGKHKHRTSIPERPNYSLSLWSIMKNCIGKELTKIPMPVNFNEPLSTLQRLTEEYEYSELLDKAAKMEDSYEQMAYIAAYTISSYATTSNRSGKPFNPLLGETYECDRTDDYGWRCFSEQVSHHPPMLAQYCEGRSWTCWQEFSMSSKFRGKYLQIIPLGIAHLVFASTGHHYTWRKVTTTVHNIIVGKLWVDHHGEMDIVNHTTGDKCHLKFIPYSYFSRETPRKVTGVVTDKEGIAKWVLQGTWDHKIEGARVIGSQGSVRGKPLLETSTPKVLWKRSMPQREYEKMYNFTELACQLNEPEEGVAPTDSRLRPDQRLMEEGFWDEANQIKVLLEEKQRATRRKREQEAELSAAEGRPYPGYEPIWFKKETDPVTGNPVHIYQGNYWECKEKQDWSACQNIFL